jgi:nucleoside-diphosphate-sugar epimerase
VGYLSTAFDAGKRVGTIAESELVHGEGFVTSYEQSKYEAELLVRAAAESIPLTIFRPSVMVGDETAGKPCALFFVLSLIRRGLLPLLPAGRHTRLDLIKAEDAAAAVATLLLEARPGSTYHVASGSEAPLLTEVVSAANAPPVRFVDCSEFTAEIRRLRRAEPRAATLYDRLMKFIGIVAYPKIFDTSAAAAALGGPVRRVDPLAGVRATFC